MTGERTHPPYFCGGDRAEVVCPGSVCQSFRPDISSTSLDSSPGESLDSFSDPIRD